MKAGRIDRAVLAARLKEHRRRRGWTLERLAAESGVSKSYLGRIENQGVKSPSHEQLARTANGLGIPVWELTGEDRVALADEVSHGSDPRAVVYAEDILTGLKRVVSERDRQHVLNELQSLAEFLAAEPESDHNRAAR
jgi:transcriptional regulator with XRE-family HTH domain